MLTILWACDVLNLLFIIVRYSRLNTCLSNKLSDFGTLLNERSFSYYLILVQNVAPSFFSPFHWLNIYFPKCDIERWPGDRFWHRYIVYTIHAQRMPSDSILRIKSLYDDVVPIWVLSITVCISLLNVTAWCLAYVSRKCLHHCIPWNNDNEERRKKQSVNDSDVTYDA